MFPSLTSRIGALGAIVMLALLGLAGALIDASAGTQESVRWVTHSADVIETTGEAMTDLREAESGQRGFILTRQPAFAQSVDDRIAQSRRAIDRVVALTVDNPSQNARARDLRTLMDRRVASLREPLDLARRGDFDGAARIITHGQGRIAMMAVSERAGIFLRKETELQAVRTETATRRLENVKLLALLGGPVIALLVLIVSLLNIRGIRRPVDLIQEAMAALGRGDRDARVFKRMGSREFVQLADGYNAMADRLDTAVADQARSERELHVANVELVRNGEALRDRGRVIELLGGMAHRMQAARSDEELAQVIHVFAPRVLPGVPGALYTHNNSRNLLVPVAGWGGLEPEREGFAPDQCWALRRGQSHFVAEPGCDIVCGHVGDASAVYHCEPLLAGGEVIGTLHLRAHIDEETQFRLTVMAENVASALVNHRLQRGLREQTIRDPLTGLFNRRYMEEALGIEIARATRSGIPMSLVMCDVDHFKRFNDEFGHDAGDAVLQAVATELRNQFRDGDVVCRFGGEEFTIIAPGTGANALLPRVEQVRRAIMAIALRQGSKSLGSTSMSFGIATWGPDMDATRLVQAADAALYRAKREGRNRAIVDLREAA